MKSKNISIVAVMAVFLSSGALAVQGSASGGGIGDRSDNEMLRGYPTADGWSDEQVAKGRLRAKAGHGVEDDVVDAIKRDHPMNSNILRDKR